VILLIYTKEVNRKNGRRKLEKKTRNAEPVAPMLNALITKTIKNIAGRTYRVTELIGCRLSASLYAWYIPEMKKGMSTIVFGTIPRAKYSVNVRNQSDKRITGKTKKMSDRVPEMYKIVKQTAVIKISATRYQR
jgi:hypothetical protein